MQLNASTLGITLASIWLNLVLGLLKVGVGLIFNSKALIADGLHSLVDLSSDIAVIIGLKAAAIPSDETHPYGHHKFASLAQILISLLILAFSTSLVYKSVAGIQEQRVNGPGIAAFIVALVSVLAKEG